MKKPEFSEASIDVAAAAIYDFVLMRALRQRYPDEADDIFAVIKATERHAARGADIHEPLSPEDFEE